MSRRYRIDLFALVAGSSPWIVTQKATPKARNCKRETSSRHDTSPSRDLGRAVLKLSLRRYSRCRSSLIRPYTRPTHAPSPAPPHAPHPRTVTEEKAMHVQIIRLIHNYPKLTHIIVFVAIHVVLHVLGLLILARIEGLTLKHASLVALRHVLIPHPAIKLII